MTSYNSLEAAQQSGATEILLDLKTRRFWTSNNPIAIRACVRLGMIHASEWPQAKSPVIELGRPVLRPMADLQLLSGVLVWLCVVGSFLASVVLGAAMKKGGS